VRQDLWHDQRGRRAARRGHGGGRGRVHIRPFAPPDRARGGVRHRQAAATRGHDRRRLPQRGAGPGGGDRQRGRPARRPAARPRDRRAGPVDPGAGAVRHPGVSRRRSCGGQGPRLRGRRDHARRPPPRLGPDLRLDAGRGARRPATDAGRRSHAGQRDRGHRPRPPLGGRRGQRRRAVARRQGPGQSTGVRRRGQEHRRARVRAHRPCPLRPGRHL
ncbi:MAG: Phosphoribosylanthranilate isomerase, partial [uncultured Acidimicrobiales bacterium]